MSTFLGLPWVIQLHIVSAVTAFVLGVLQFIGPKGVLLHRVLGWMFVVSMVVAAASAVFIRDLNDGRFSWIHLFVPLTAFGLISGVLAARRGRINSHRSAMIGLFAGALVVAGGFAFLPGRAMHAIVFGG